MPIDSQLRKLLAARGYRPKRIGKDLLVFFVGEPSKKYVARVTPLGHTYFALRPTPVDITDEVDLNDLLHAINEVNKDGSGVYTTLDIKNDEIERTLHWPAPDAIFAAEELLEMLLQRIEAGFETIALAIAQPKLHSETNLSDEDISTLRSSLTLPDDGNPISDILNSHAFDAFQNYLNEVYKQNVVAYDEARYNVTFPSEMRDDFRRRAVDFGLAMITDEDAAERVQDAVIEHPLIDKAVKILEKRFPLIDKEALRVATTDMIQNRFFEEHESQTRRALINKCLTNLALNEKPSLVLFPLGGVDLVGVNVVKCESFTLFRMCEQACAMLSIYDRLDGPLRLLGSQRKNMARYDNSVWICAPFRGDPYRALEDGAYKVGQFLDCLRFYAAASGQTDYFIDFIENTKARARRGWGFYQGHAVQGALPIEEIDAIAIDGSFAANYSEFGLDAIISLIEGDEGGRSAESLEGCFLRALRYFGSATFGVPLETRLLNYVGVLEAFLGFDKMRVKAGLMENVAFILGASIEERKEYQKLVSDIYDSRSNIAHGRNSEDLEIAVRQAHDLATRLLLTFAKALRSRTSTEEIRDKLELVRLGGPAIRF